MGKIFRIFGKLILGALVSFQLNCGNNTDTPVIPFVFLTVAGVPQVVGIIPTTEYPIDSSLIPDGQADQIPLKPQFIIKYYVTNTEQNFAGYNLAITSATPSLAATYSTGNIYSENGILPSFPHLATEASTDPTRLKRRRLANRIPPPGLVPFQHCEVYTFTIRAYLTNGFMSNPSASVSACASPAPGKCPVGSSCNTSTCSNASCSATEKATCSVGTLCNPCLITGAESTGCECPAGVSPPGCNP
ncbi:MAG: hypothetical protein KDK36_08435 [Leptospiraceae bacterium]|nr:hypothetical protein [Leptospiraceae bacterium]